jgi:hypothetical protein
MSAKPCISTADRLSIEVNAGIAQEYLKISEGIHVHDPSERLSSQTSWMIKRNPLKEGKTKKWQVTSLSGTLRRFPTFGDMRGKQPQ